MANNVAALVPTVLAQAHVVFRQNTIMPRLVNTDLDSEFKEKGDTVNVPTSSPRTVEDVTPGLTVATPEDSAVTTTPVSLDYWKRSSFYLTEREMTKIDADKKFIPGQIEECVIALADYTNGILNGLYKKVRYNVGTAGTNPFATTSDIIADTRLKLNSNNVPKALRRFVLNDAAENAALKLADFKSVSAFGKDTPIREGELGRILGFDFASMQDMPTHTAGTASGKTVTVAVLGVVGATTVTLKVSATTGTIKIGDLIKITTGGVAYYYTAAADATLDTTGVAVTVNEPLEAAHAVDDAVVVTATHSVNLAFHRSAFVFASRPVAKNAMPGGTVTSVMTDPLSGIALRLDVIPVYHQMVWEMSILFGVKALRPDAAVRVLG